jgi:hypothetical protein
MLDRAIAVGHEQGAVVVLDIAGRRDRRRRHRMGDET